MSDKTDVERLRKSLGRIIDDVETAFLNIDGDENFKLGGHRLADMLRARLGLSEMGSGWRREYHTKPGEEHAFNVKQMKLAAWSPDPEGKMASTQVHMVLHVHGIKYPLVMRFTGPTTVKNLIRELAWLRDEVWPEAKGDLIVHERNDE